MEFGLHQSLPMYSGGLGILAGDHLKSASDARVPLTGIGLFLRDGYFKQYFGDRLIQQTEYPSIDVTRHPLEPVRDEAGETVVVTVHCGTEPVHLRAFKLQVGHVELFLLDSDFNSNQHEDRFLTSRLYQGRTKIRLKQEIVLGIGGVRLLRALGRNVDVFHMNEGHCAFLTLELLRERGYHGQEDEVRSRCVFTTHTPVLAGHDRFEPHLFLDQLQTFRSELGCSEHELLAHGRINPDDTNEPFTMTVLALRMARSANAVSELNGAVTRRQWHALYSDRPVDEVPIEYVTNGVHLGTWTAPAARLFLKKHIGPFEEIMRSPEPWNAIHNVSDEDLWAYRSRLRKRFVDYVVARCRRQSLELEPDLSPDALTIGFARRFAGYKRATLLFRDRERASRLFSHIERPVQIVFAGKAHPDNDEGVQAIQEILEAARLPGFAGKIIFLENYHIGVARQLVSGCDVWLNTPRRPHEACGTSGQKINVHGGLNLSILDGWWSEGYDGTNGWAIGDRSADENMDEHAQDARDAEILYSVLENEVVPLFYDRNEANIPVEWLKRIRNAMSSLTFRFSAHRMITDYASQIYNVERYEEVH
jgi:alpha-glucan phosphorylase-like protein